jgi:hypothetical protein
MIAVVALLNLCAATWPDVPKPSRAEMKMPRR